MDKKRLVQLALGIFVAIIFISSYVSLTNYNTSTKTTTIPGTAYAEGTAKAVLTGYGSPLYVNVSCSNATLRNATSNIVITNLNLLENNGSVLDSFPTGTNISIATENMSAYNIFSFLRSKAGAGAGCIKGYATAYLALPQLLNITVVSNNQKLQVAVPSKDANVSIYTAINRSIGTKLNTKLSLLITSNGSISQLTALILGIYTTTTTTVKPASTTVPANQISNTIPSNTISSNTISSNTIPSNTVASNTMTSNTISSNTMTSNSIASNTVTTSPPSNSATSNTVSNSMNT